MTAAPRLPEELWPGRTYNRLTNVETSYTLILPEGRMPTVRGRGGVIADRTAVDPQARVPHLIAGYMLAYLPGFYPDAPHHTLQLVDYDYWRNKPPEHQLHPRLLPPGRYRVELWDAEPEEEDHGHPERDYTWDSMNPVLSWDVPAEFGLTGARAAMECLAGLLVRGEVEANPRRSRRTVAAYVRHTRAVLTPRMDRLTDEGERLQFAREAQDRYVAWLNRPEVQQWNRAQQLMYRAARRAEREAAKPRTTHVQRALSRGRRHWAKTALTLVFLA